MEGGQTDDAYGVEATGATPSVKPRALFEKEEVESGLRGLLDRRSVVRFRWTLLGRTHETMVLEGSTSLPAVQKSHPGGAPFVTSMSTPGRAKSLGTSRTRSRCCFRLLAPMRVDTK